MSNKKNLSLKSLNPFALAGLVAILLVSATFAWDPAGWVPPTSSAWVDLMPRFLIAEPTDPKFIAPPHIAVDRTTATLYATLSYVWKSSDSGQTFSSMNRTACFSECPTAINVSPDGHKMSLSSLHICGTASSAYSPDGGLTWKNFTFGPAYGLECCLVNWDEDAKLVFAQSHTWPSRMWISKDGGGSFTEIDTMQSRCSFNMAVLEHGVLMTHENSYPPMRSADTGRTWQSVSVPSYTNGAGSKVDIQFIYVNYRFKGKNYWLTNGGVYTTADAGQTWTVVGSNFPDSLLQNGGGPLVGPMFGVDENHMVVMLNNSFIETVDGGNTWHTLAGTPISPMGGYPYMFSCAYDPIHDILYAQYSWGEGGYGVPAHVFSRLSLGRWKGTTAVQTAALPSAAAGISLLSANPMISAARLQFAIQKTGNVTLAIYNPSGKLIRTLVYGSTGAGIHECMWDGRNAQGALVPAGVYMVRLETRDGTKTVRAMVIR
jgi:hypothetical protein